MVLLPDVLPDLEPAEDVGEGNEEDDGSHETAGSVGSLSVPGVRVARHEVRDHTCRGRAS